MLAYAVGVKDEYKTDALFQNLENKLNITAKSNFPNSISDFIIDKVPNNLKMNILLEEINLFVKENSPASSWRYVSDEIILPTASYGNNVTERTLIAEANAIADEGVKAAVNIVIAASLTVAYGTFKSRNTSIRTVLGEKMYAAITENLNPA